MKKLLWELYDLVLIDEEDTSIEVIEKVKLDTNAFDMPKFIEQQ